tara:strand:- start:709 stop:1029 length:321 start_codon:yes stop_codon:yes gene_type:complete
MNSFTVIKGLHDSEKTQHLKDLFVFRQTRGMKENVLHKYTLRVDVRANKHQIRQAVQALFPKVKVESVNTATVKGKAKRARTKVAGYTAEWKKAVITLKEGEIELL